VLRPCLRIHEEVDGHDHAEEGKDGQPTGQSAASRLASPRMSRVEQPSSKHVAMTAAISGGNPGRFYSSLKKATVVSQPLAF
jgi:hypothetical protein